MEAYLSRLRDAAEQGDLHATGVLLSTLPRVFAAARIEAEGDTARQLGVLEQALCSLNRIRILLLIERERMRQDINALKQSQTYLPPC